MNRILLPILFYFICGKFYCQADEVSTETERNKKVFSLFTVVTFPNDQCTTKSSTSTYGTCFSESECTSKGGTVDGNCAAGFGVCCTFTLSSCSTTVSQNCTYIQNPTYPSGYTTTGSCAYSVTPLSSDICQLRLDFDAFDLVEGTTGACTDSFTVTGPTGRNPAVLCGTLTGMHLYVEQGRSTTATTLTFTTASTTGITWNIKVAQIECSSKARAYTDCNQYITGKSGTVQSYNWPTVQLSSKTHNICIRREAGYCGIQYNTYTGTTPDAFALDDITLTTVNGQAQVITSTAHAYLLIPGGPGATDLFSGGIFCDGLALTCGITATTDGTQGGAVYRSGGINGFILTHGVTAINTAAGLGFKLSFNQLPCTNGASMDTTV